MVYRVFYWMISADVIVTEFGFPVIDLSFVSYRNGQPSCCYRVLPSFRVWRCWWACVARVLPGFTGFYWVFTGLESTGMRRIIFITKSKAARCVRVCARDVDTDVATRVGRGWGRGSVDDVIDQATPLAFFASTGAWRRVSRSKRPSRNRFLTVFLLFFFCLFAQTQRPEQSVMQALESLNDGQVRRNPLTMSTNVPECCWKCT